MRLNCDATEDELIDVIEGNRYTFLNTTPQRHNNILWHNSPFIHQWNSPTHFHSWTVMCAILILIFIFYRVYIPCIYVLNKIDQISIEELDILYRIPHCVPISAHHEWNLDDLLDKIWTYLDLIRMYFFFSNSDFFCWSVPNSLNFLIKWCVVIQNHEDKFQTTMNLLWCDDHNVQFLTSVTNCTSNSPKNSNSTSSLTPHFWFLRIYWFQKNHWYSHICQFSALVWGSSVKHNPQKVGKDHLLNDEDVVQIVKKIN